MKYIIYVRKSTEDREDRQVLSIDSQIEEVQRKFPNLEVIEIIKESKSAYKSNNRPEFQRMVELFQSKKAEGLLAWHPDRLSREPLSGSMIIHLLDQKLIKDLKFASYNFDNSPEGKMMLALALSQSKYFSEKLSVDVKRGMNKKCKMGSMPTKPPLGYMPDKLADKGEKKHIKDPDRFDLVRRMWELMLTGQYSILEIVRKSREWSLTTRPTKRMPSVHLSQSTIYKTFSNIFYTGSFQWNGDIYEGNHPAMVSLEEFDKVQILIGNKHVPRPQKYESITSGLVKCPCGASIVVEHIKKRIKKDNSIKIFNYARCSRSKKGQECHEAPVPLIDLETSFVERLSKIRISEKFHKWAIEHINEFRSSENKTRDLEVRNLRKAHDDCQRKLDNLLTLKISPSNSDNSLLSDDEFKARKSDITMERDRLSEAINQIDYRADKTANLLTEAFDVAYNAQREFNEAEKDIKKRKLILSKIGANFILKDKALHMEAKRHYVKFEIRLPEIRQTEELGELETIRFGAPKKATLERIIYQWSR